MLFDFSIVLLPGLSRSLACVSQATETELQLKRGEDSHAELTGTQSFKQLLVESTGPVRHLLCC